MKAKKAAKAAKKSVPGSPKKTSARTKTVRARSDPGGVEDYLAGIPESSRKTFEALRAAVRDAAPKDAQEVRSYGIVALKTHKVLVWYAAFAQHCSLFPTASVLRQFRDELKGCKVSKGTVQFPLDRRVPAALVKKLVRARVAETAKKK